MAIAFTMTGLDLVTRAMQNRRCLALGRTPTAAESDYGIERLNQMLKAMAGDGVGPWAEATATATITANVAEVALSPRPADVLDVDLVVSASLNRKLHRWEPDQYAELPNPSSSGEPSIYALRQTVSATYLRVWPVPTANRSLNYRYVRVLDDVVASDPIDIPQDWIGDIEAMLAIRLTAFANNNPDLPTLAAIAERRIYDKTRPDSYLFEPDCYCG